MHQHVLDVHFSAAVCRGSHPPVRMRPSMIILVRLFFGLPLFPSLPSLILPHFRAVRIEVGRRSFRRGPSPVISSPDRPSFRRLARSVCPFESPGRHYPATSLPPPLPSPVPLPLSRSVMLRLLFVRPSIHPSIHPSILISDFSVARALPSRHVFLLVCGLGAGREARRAGREGLGGEPATRPTTALHIFPIPSQTDAAAKRRGYHPDLGRSTVSRARSSPSYITLQDREEEERAKGKAQKCVLVFPAVSRW